MIFKNKGIVKWFLYALACFLVSLTIFFIYCWSLFQSLDTLMQTNLKSLPSVLYSDVFLFRKGEAYEDLFLEDRLNELRIPFEKKGNSLQWIGRDFNYPEYLLKTHESYLAKKDQAILIEVEDGRIEKIEVDHEERDALILEPTPVAQLAGSSHAIQKYIPLSEMPTLLLQAIIAIEDQRFLEHVGFDLRGLLRAIWVNLKAKALSQGASTLTQQLVKNLSGAREKTIFRKIKELILAILIEVRYSKDEILEKYLNEVYFGQIGALEVHGVYEAAFYFYNKSLNELSLAEMALMAGIIRGPAYYSPYKYLERALQRKNTVLQKMNELHLISEEQYQAAAGEPLKFSPPRLVNNKAPYFVDFIKAQILQKFSDKISVEDLSTQGLQIFTTLDLQLQRRADQATQNAIEALEKRYKIQRPLRIEGALVVAHAASGFIRALVGGRSYAQTNFNRVLNMKRQIGSAFKPFVYLTALEAGKDENTELEDAPWKMKDRKGKVWAPQNYEKNYRGKITLREAFIHSLNIPAAKLGIEVGIDKVIEVTQRLGVQEPLPSVPSLSLGSVELPILDVVQAYGTIANTGERVALSAIRTVTDEHNQTIALFHPSSEPVFDAEAMEKLQALLKGVVEEGTAKNLKNLGYAKPAYGKTGTTSFYRDAWFAGFSQGLVGVSWVGFEELKTEGKPPAVLTGASAALPIWAQFFKEAKPSASGTDESSKR